jgi:hypothetical protein
VSLPHSIISRQMLQAGRAQVGWVGGQRKETSLRIFKLKKVKKGNVKIHTYKGMKQPRELRLLTAEARA